MRDSWDSREIITLVFSSDAARNVPTLTAHRSSFCHAELVSASVRGDVLEMARCEILKQVQDDICVLIAHRSKAVNIHKQGGRLR